MRALADQSRVAPGWLARGVVGRRLLHVALGVLVRASRLVPVAVSFLLAAAPGVAAAGDAPPVSPPLPAVEVPAPGGPQGPVPAGRRGAAGVLGYVQDPAALTVADGSFVTKHVQGKQVVAELSTVPRTSGGADHRPVDTRVRAVPGPYPLEASGAVRPVRFGSSSSSLLQVALAGGSVTLSSPDLTVGAPAQVGSVVHYPRAARDTSVDYQVLPDGVKESLVLGSPSAPRSFAFHLADPTGQLGDAVQASDGSVRFTGRQGDLSLGLPAPIAYEQAHAVTALPAGPSGALSPPTGGGAVSLSPHPGLDPGSAPSAHLAVARKGDGFDLTVAVDEAWLKGKAFPVVLDPTLTFSNANGTITDGTAPVTPGSGINYRVVPHTDLRVGPQQEYNYMWRSFLRFNTDSIPVGSTVTSANFHWVREWGGGYSPRAMELHAITGSWDFNSGAKSIEYQTEAAASATGTPDTRDFDVRALAQRWVNHSVYNGGLVAQMNPEVIADAACCGFYGYYASRSTNAPDDSYRPSLTVTYTPPARPNPPRSVTAAPGGDGVATVSWAAPAGTDPNAPVDAYWVQTYLADGTYLGEQQTSGTTTSARVGGLTPGKDYYFSVVAHNMAGFSDYEFSPTVRATGFDGSPGSPVTGAVSELAPGVLPAPGTGTLGTVADGARAAVDGAAPPVLGYEAWQSYVGVNAGGQTRASVNVANGNLVVQTTDSTPVQAHGRLAYVLRRTYNSQAPVPVVAPAGSVGPGWSLNLGEEAGDFTSIGLTGDGLEIPDPGSLTPGAVTLVDRDGTRHTFQPKALPGGLAMTSPLLTAGQAPADVAPVARRALSGQPGALVCVTHRPTPLPRACTWACTASCSSARA